MKDKYKLTPATISALKYSSYGFYVVVPIFLGLTIGIVLDKVLNTRPMLVLVFLFLGTISSFYNLFVLIKESVKHDRQSDRTKHNAE